MSNISAVELLDALQQLNDQLCQFTNMLQQSKLPFWLPGPAAGTLPEAARLYGDIWYHTDQDGRNTISQHGLIGASPDLINAGEQLNQSKALFQQLATEYRLREDKELQLQLHKRTEKLAELLHRHGASRLHLKQCYRQIPILAERPEKVGFSWYTSGRSIRKMTPEEAEQRLLKMDTSSSHIQQQLQAVGLLRPGDMLAQIQNQVPVMRANFVWKRNHQLLRKARNISLPILLPLSDENPLLPEYNEPPPNPPESRSRLARNDLKIEPQPYLPSLRAHRYLS